MAEWDNYDPNAQSNGTNTPNAGSGNAWGGTVNQDSGNTDPFANQNGYNTNYNYNPNGMPNQYQPPQQNQSNVPGIVSLILGIFGFVGCFLFQEAWGVVLDIAIGICAIVFGVMGRKKQTGRGMATAGMVLGIVLLALYVLLIVLIIAAVVLGVTALSDYVGDYYYYY